MVPDPFSWRDLVPVAIRRRELNRRAVTGPTRFRKSRTVRMLYQMQESAKQSLEIDRWLGWFLARMRWPKGCVLRIDMTKMALLKMASVLSLGAFSLAANSLTGTATLTADNHYGLYTGLSDGSNLNLIGRNEKGYSGDPGNYNWSLPETWSVSLEAGEHLYVLAWDDGGPQSWIGQFNFNSTLYSDTANWEYTIAAGANLGTDGDLPSLATVLADIETGAWNPVTFELANGASPWGMIAGIDAAANFIAADGFGSSVPSDSHYVLFRNRDPLMAQGAAPVPEAGTVAAGVTLAILAGVTARRRRMAAK